MSTPLPASGDTNWYAWATQTDAGVRPLGVRAYANATAQTVAAAAYPVYLDLNAAEFNDSSSLYTVDLTGDKITVNSGGVYLVSWEVSYWANSSAGVRDAYLTKNGGNAISIASGDTSGSQAAAYRSNPIRLAAGDYIQVIAYVEGALTYIIENAAFRSGLGLWKIGV